MTAACCPDAHHRLRIRALRATANDLHGNYYRGKRHLDAKSIGADLESVAELVEMLAPLTSL